MASLWRLESATASRKTANVRSVRPAPIQFAATDGTMVVGDLVLEDLPLAALIEGIRVNPKFADWIFGDQAFGNGNGTFTESPTISDTVPVDRVFSNVLQRIKAPEEISFLFSLVDSGTGREFQDQAAHNLASLGKSNGERPFRLLAQPFHFAPRSTLRLQITERTEGVRGTLFIVLYGYRVLGAATCPEPIARQLRGSPMCPVETIGNPDARIIPFDYVSRLQLTGRRGNQVEDELPVNADGGFVGTSIGYGLAVEQRNVSLQMAAVADVQDATLRDELLDVEGGTARSTSAICHSASFRRGRCSMESASDRAGSGSRCRTTGCWPVNCRSSCSAAFSRA